MTYFEALVSLVAAMNHGNPPASDYEARQRVSRAQTQLNEVLRITIPSSDSNSNG